MRPGAHYSRYFHLCHLISTMQMLPGLLKTKREKKRENSNGDTAPAPAEKSTLKECAPCCSGRIIAKCKEGVNPQSPG